VTLSSDDGNRTDTAPAGVFRRALGADFDRLHPQLQRRFGVATDTGYACVGSGVMREIRRGPWWTVPFLQIGRLRNILVADVGTDVPFTIENYPYRDPFGRETVTFVREYRVPGARRPSRFDATMVLDPARGTVVDYLGTHQHLAVDLDLRVEPDGSLLLRSGAQRFYEGRFVGFRFPMSFSGRATLRERYDDEAGEFRIDLEVRNPVFGFLFGYSGSFTCDYPAAADAPARLRPVRHERRF
jgi:hypothetical protein